MALLGGIVEVTFGAGGAPQWTIGAVGWGDVEAPVVWTAPPYMVANVSGQEFGSADLIGQPGAGRYASRIAVAALYGNDETTSISVPSQIRLRVHFDVPGGSPSSVDRNVALTADGDGKVHGTDVLTWGETAVVVTGVELGEGSVALDYNYCYFNPPSIFLPATVLAFEHKDHAAGTVDGTPVEYPSYPAGSFA